MEYLTIRKDLRNIDLKSLYFGGNYKPTKVRRFLFFVIFSINKTINVSKLIRKPQAAMTNMATSTNKKALFRWILNLHT
jgi:hypothetical protein